MLFSPPTGLVTVVGLRSPYTLLAANMIIYTCLQVFLVFEIHTQCYEPQENFRRTQLSDLVKCLPYIQQVIFGGKMYVLTSNSIAIQTLCTMLASFRTKRKNVIFFSFCSFELSASERGQIYAGLPLYNFIFIGKCLASEPGLQRLWNLKLNLVRMSLKCFCYGRSKEQLSLECSNCAQVSLLHIFEIHLTHV